jgi:hypothetical protein
LGADRGWELGDGFGIESSSCGDWVQRRRREITGQRLGAETATDSTGQKGTCGFGIQGRGTGDGGRAAARGHGFDGKAMSFSAA